MAASAVLQDSPFSINDFLAEERGKDLLRFSTAGSVDDGKSTLIGRLLYDTQSVYDDQVRSIEGKGTTAPGQIDFALLTDGLRAEREQGITIDVAYRYFSTARRKFIIADTPGHEQYTRNMDLVGYDEQTFRAIERDFHDLLKQISTHTGNPVEAVFVPVSALLGDNVVHRSEAMGWYAGPSLLELLETLPSASDTRDAPFRFSVQRVLRPDSEFRGFAGQISSGTIHPGDRITVLPSGLTAYVTRIVTFNGDLERAHAPLSVTVTLDREVDVSRGDLLVSESAPATATRRFKAALVWMDQSSLERGRRYLLKHMSLTVPAHIAALEYRNNIRTLEHEAADSLSVNEIGVATLQLARPVPLDRYAENRSTGAFILIDPETNGTVAAGMVTEVQADEGDAEGVALSSGPVTAQERAAQWGHLGGVLELHGPAELLDRIERSLFVAKAVTIRCSSEQEAQFAATSGFIALLAKPSEEGLLTAQAGGEKIQVDGGDPDQAVATVLRLLHRVAILSARGTSGVQ